MVKLIEEIKKRKIRKWIAVYLSIAVTLIGITNILINRYNLSSKYFDILLITLVFGLFFTLTFSWFHGERGRQKFSLIEILLHSIIFVAFGTVLYFVTSSATIKLLPENITTIAVLPFTNMNKNPQDDFFSDGITEDIITQLSKVSNLKVISRTSVMKYKNSNKSIKEIAQELGAGSILEGSVRRVNNRIRIVGQLIDANKDEHLWANTYDRELKDIFAIQSEIAQRIAGELAVKLTPLEKELIDKKPTENIDAYTLYLKGKHYYYNYTKEDNEKAISLFNKALNIDSNYALALAGLADAYNQRVTKYWMPNSWLDSAISLSKKALEINPRLPEAYKSLAASYDAQGKNDLAAINYRKAIRLNPNYTSAILNYGQLKLFAGEYDKAYFWIKKANVLAPDNILGIISRSYIYRHLGCDSLAIVWIKKAIELEPENTFAKTVLGENYLYSGNYNKAQKVFEEVISQNKKWILGWFLGSRLASARRDFKTAAEYVEKYMEIAGTDPEYFYGYYLMKLNRRKEGEKIILQQRKSYIDYIDKNPDATILDFIALTEIHAILNEREKAFKMWNKAIAKGYTDIPRTLYYPFLDTLKNDSRYNLMIRKMNLRIDSLKNQIRKNYPDNDICN